VLGQWDPHSFENQLNCCGVKKVSEDDDYNNDDDGDSNKLHFNICRAIGMKSDNEHRYEHVSKLV
jgi:hypothetical protein